MYSKIDALIYGDRRQKIDFILEMKLNNKDVQLSIISIKGSVRRVADEQNAKCMSIYKKMESGKTYDQ